MSWLALLAPAIPAAVGGLLWTLLDRAEQRHRAALHAIRLGTREALERHDVEHGTDLARRAAPAEPWAPGSTSSPARAWWREERSLWRWDAS